MDGTRSTHGFSYWVTNYIKTTYYIIVMVDKFSKVALFIPIKSTHKIADIARISLGNIKLHGLPKEIVSSKKTKFTSSFWRSIFADMGT